MSKILGKWLSNNAKQTVLEYKLVALRNGVLNKASGAGSSVVVTTEVEASAALTGTPVTPQTALTALGIYTGTVSSAIDPKKVLVRAAGTDNGVDDGSGDEIYGTLTEASGVYTLNFFKADGTAYTFAATTPVDFYFVAIYNEFSKPVDAHLAANFGGVIDATSFDTFSQLIGTLVAGTSYTATAATVAGHLAGIDSALGGINTNVSNIVNGTTNISYTGVASTPTAASITVAGALTALSNAFGNMAGLTSLVNITGTVASTLFSSIDSYLTNLTASQVAYVPTTGSLLTGETTVQGAIDNLETLVAGISATLPVWFKQEFTLDSADIAAELVALTHVPLEGSVQVVPVGGPMQSEVTDYSVNVSAGQVAWTGLALAPVLEVGDVLMVQYQYLP